MEPDRCADAKGRQSRAGRAPVVAWPAPGPPPVRSAQHPMIRLFGRKKPESEAAGDDRSGSATDGRRGYSLEELASAFPDAAAPEAPAGAPEAPDAAPTPPEAPEPAAAPSADAAPTAPAAPASPAATHAEPAPASEPAAGPAQAPVPPQLPDAATAPAPSPDDPDPAAPPAPPGKSGWRERLRGSAFARGVGGLFSRHPKLDDDLLAEIETALLTADVGVAASTELVERLRARMKAREFAEAP